MADKKLQGIKVAILVANDFEQIEMTEPRKALDDAGAQTFLIAPSQDQCYDQFVVVHAAKGEVQALNHDQQAQKFKVDVPLEQAEAGDYDALLLPGGAMSPDQLRMSDKAKHFVSLFDECDKPIAFICHSPWTLISANRVVGRTLTSWPSLQDDIRNAGGNWVNEPVVFDANWVSSRGPADIPAFNQAMITLFSERGRQKMAA